MIIEVLMLAYEEPGIVREVEIPNDTPDEAVLEAVFKWGQNEFQNKPCCSVSMGDVIVLKRPVMVIGNPVPQVVETPILIRAMGFVKLSLVSFRTYIEMSQRDRSLFALKIG